MISVHFAPIKLEAHQMVMKTVIVSHCLRVYVRCLVMTGVKVTVNGTNDAPSLYSYLTDKGAMKIFPHFSLQPSL